MALARASSPREALLWALNDLEESSFKTLKFHLRDLTQFHLARGELEGLSRVDLASKLVSMYGAQEAVRVVSRSLRAMNLMELVDYLSQVCLNGECSPREGEEVAPETPQALQMLTACNLHLSLYCPLLIGDLQSLRVSRQGV